MTGEGASAARRHRGAGLECRRGRGPVAAKRVRVERLKILSRTKPEAPATLEFNSEEIDTAILLRHSAALGG